MIWALEGKDRLDTIPKASATAGVENSSLVEDHGVQSWFHKINVIEENCADSDRVAHTNIRPWCRRVELYELSMRSDGPLLTSMI